MLQVGRALQVRHSDRQCFQSILECRFAAQVLDLVGATEPADD
jgi:hypothetical protein